MSSEPRAPIPPLLRGLQALCVLAMLGAMGLVVAGVHTGLAAAMGIVGGPGSAVVGWRVRAL